MHIAVLGFIGTNDILSESARASLGNYPRGREGAPLVSNLVREYLNQGHQVLAITMDLTLNDDEPPFTYEEGRLTFVVVPARKHIFRPNGRRPGRTADLYSFERAQMLAVLQAYKPDVVHAHWTYEYALAALAYTPDAIITIHDNPLTILRYVRTLERLFSVLMAWQVFHRGRRFTAVSPYTAKAVQKWTRSPITVIPNPIRIPARISTPVIPDAPIISMVVNGWDDHKNLETALLAFKLVQFRYPNAVMWAFGTAFPPDGKAAAFCQTHLIPNVVLFGPTRHSEMLEKVAQSTLLLHTSLEESFGMVVVEAMSFGIPVVAGKASGAIPWVVGDGGLLVDVTEVAVIVMAINRLLANPFLYEQLATNARRNVEKRFPIEQVADQYIDLYQQCLTPESVIESVNVTQ